MLHSLLQGKEIIDVRSPVEFQKGHIPKAQNIFLFSDGERSVIGTLYKQKGKERAIEEGVKLVDLKRLYKELRQIPKERGILLYCARGGLRSFSVAFLLHLLDRKHTLLEGGYKTFRNWALSQFSKKYKLQLLAGKTCVGKTSLLEKLAQEKKQTVNLEKLANHFGSVFGGIDKLQPTQEQFENELALILAGLDPAVETYLEDESRTIGKIVLPAAFFAQMQTSALQEIDDTYENRLKRCLALYGPYPKVELKNAVYRLQKKLGSMKTKAVIELIENDNYQEAVKQLFEYYDRYYLFGMQKRQEKILTEAIVSV